ncbi:hypothetical protein Y1Q_0000835 [Alligator mississippiensis]|uniref:Uncharacterized protein n=1 Tax=Alligator mississippiensis TaxID=8496 RepID=A0A151MVZ8_ALLMI|nr:hypothetical protein Y1Q_0000835 [Alligator mississippiensis]
MVVSLSCLLPIVAEQGQGVGKPVEAEGAQQHSGHGSHARSSPSRMLAIATATGHLQVISTTEFSPRGIFLTPYLHRYIQTLRLSL